VKATFRPIDKWPGATTPPLSRKSKYIFQATHENSLAKLKFELEKLGAREVVIQCDVEEKDVRMDGALRSGASPKGPGIIVSFESKHGPLQYATDVFEDWKSNLRAIALGLEALRKIERYGITRSGEQYKGWKQLGSGIALSGPQMTPQEAARFVASHGGRTSAGSIWHDLISNGPLRQVVYREAAKRLHPDAGGSKEEFQRLQEAKRVLDGASA
jgi:hypothetical protein